MVLDDLLEDMFEREDKPGKRRKDEEDRDGRKRKYDEDEEEHNDEKETKNEERGRKRGFFDRLTELFD